MDARHRRDCGFSTVEMLIALAIGAVLVAAAVPSFSRLRHAASVGAGANQMLAALHFARSAAILRNVPTVLCLSVDGQQCLTTANVMATGWIVFQDASRSSPPQLSRGDVVLRRLPLPREVSVSGTRAAITYWPTLRAGTTGTYLFCDARRRIREGRSVVVSQTGRPRLQGGVSCAF